MPSERPSLALRASAGLVAAIFLAPVASLVVLALATSWRATDILPEQFSFARFIDIVARRPDLVESLLLSVALSALVAVVSTAAGFVASRAVAWSRARGALTVLAYAPFAISPVVLGAALLHVLIQLGLAGTFAGVFLAQTSLCFGFAVVFFLGLWTPRMRAMQDLVRTLGGTDRQALWRALVPTSREMIFVCLAQSFLISWVQYGLTLVVGQGKVRTLPVRVYDYFFEASINDAAVVGVVLVVPPLLLLALSRRLMREGPA